MKPTVAIFRIAWVAGGAERYLTDLGEALEPLADVRFGTLQQEPPEGALRLLGRESALPRFEAWPADSLAIERRTRDFDLFINAASGLLVAGHARRDWLVVFSPGPPQRRLWPRLRRTATRILCRAIRTRLGTELTPARTMRRWALHPIASERASLATYERVIAISDYAAGAITRRWGIASDVLHPGVDTSFFSMGSARAESILSVGRFASYGNQKQHAHLIEMFRRVHARNPGWTLVLAGSVEDSAPCRRYLAELREQAADLPVDFRVDVSLSALRDLYSSTCLYWHATGLGVNPIRDPDRVEQFGIVLVEAMASGVIPIAYNAGGVSEIIQHGRSGFLWRQNEELVEITDRLIRCPALRAELASEGRARSGQFELGTFREKVRAWFG